MDEGPARSIIANLAWGALAARGSGRFVLYAWLAGAASYGFFGLAAAGFTWRQSLQFGRWLSGRSGD